MKIIFKVVPFILVVFGLLFFGCEKDQEILQESLAVDEMNTKTLDIKGHFVKGDSIRQINKNLDLFLRKRFEQNNTALAKDATSTTYGFTIDTERVLQLVGDTYTNYIFSVHRSNQVTTDILENCIMKAI